MLLHDVTTGEPAKREVKKVIDDMLSALSEDTLDGCPTLNILRLCLRLRPPDANHVATFNICKCFMHHHTHDGPTYRKHGGCLTRFSFLPPIIWHAMEWRASQGSTSAPIL
jgi:hypothetical protein